MEQYSGFNTSDFIYDILIHNQVESTDLRTDENMKMPKLRQHFGISSPIEIDYPE